MFPYDVEPMEDKKAALMVNRDTHLAPVDYGVPIPAVIIHHINVIQVGVCPVYQLLDHIQCHSSGLLNFIIHQPGPVGAVHIAALHFGHVPIVSEEKHSAESGSNHIIKYYKGCCLIYCESSRVFNLCSRSSKNCISFMYCTANKYTHTYWCIIWACFM